MMEGSLKRPDDMEDNLLIEGIRLRETEIRNEVATQHHQPLPSVGAGTAMPVDMDPFEIPNARITLESPVYPTPEQLPGCSRQYNRRAVFYAASEHAYLHGLTLETTHLTESLVHQLHSPIGENMDPDVRSFIMDVATNLTRINAKRIPTERFIELRSVVSSATNSNEILAAATQETIIGRQELLPQTPAVRAAIRGTPKVPVTHTATRPMETPVSK